MSQIQFWTNNGRGDSLFLRCLVEVDILGLWDVISLSVGWCHDTQQHNIDISRNGQGPRNSHPFFCNLSAHIPAVVDGLP